MTAVEVLEGKCEERMRELPDASIDAIVTDPPYGLGEPPPIRNVLEAWLAGRVYEPRGRGFMGKDWDAFVPDLSIWQECLRVLRPGGYLLSFGGTRTFDLVAVGLRLAGFEIRDTVCWMFGSGFPKSLDVEKAIEPDPRAEEWHGWGTALKPAFEPILVARKPLAGTVAANVLEYGTGAINVDACRVDGVKDVPASPRRAEQGSAYGDLGNARGDESGFDPLTGRWPANVVLSHTEDCVLVGDREIKGDGNWSGSTESVGYEGGWDTSDHPRDRRVPVVETVEVWECAPDCAVSLLDTQTGELRSGEPGTMRLAENTGSAYGAESRASGTPMTGYGDVGGASRFFYCAKTSRAERNAGLDATFAERDLRWSAGDQSPGTFQGEGTDRAARNHHPTVKPIELMRWLLRLVTPPDGVVLDPFLGSGSTGCAAILEPTVGRFVGVERESDYLAISRARIAFWQEHGEGALEVVRMRSQSEERRREIADAGQLDLLGP